MYVRVCVRALVRGSIAVGERRVSPLTPEPGFLMGPKFCLATISGSAARTAEAGRGASVGGAKAEAASVSASIDAISDGITARAGRRSPERRKSESAFIARHTVVRQERPPPLMASVENGLPQPKVRSIFFYNSQPKERGRGCERRREHPRGQFNATRSI